MACLSVCASCRVDLRRNELLCCEDGIWASARPGKGDEKQRVDVRSLFTAVRIDCFMRRLRTSLSSDRSSKCSKRITIGGANHVVG